MTNFALVDSAGNLVRYQSFDGVPPVLAAMKGLRWLAATPPTYDPALQHAPVPSFPVSSGGTAVQYTVVAISSAEIATNLAAAKTARKALFKSTLENLINSSNTYTTVEGWVVDARRTDLDNLKNYRDLLVSISATTATVRMHDNIPVDMGITRLQSLVSELIAAGLALYQHKWALEAQVDDPSITTVAQVNAVVW